MGVQVNIKKTEGIHVSILGKFVGVAGGSGSGSGTQGPKGDDGKSAYEIWLEQGNEGSEQDFLDSLKGDQGEKGDKMTYDDLTEEEKNDLASRVEVEVPTKTSQLTNDSGFVTSEELATAVSQSIINALNTAV